MDFYTYTAQKDYDREDEGEEYSEAIKKLVEAGKEGVLVAEVYQNSILIRTTFMPGHILQSFFRETDFSGADCPTNGIKVQVLTFNEKPPKKFLTKLEKILGEPLELQE